jgi:hypothetical protein
MAATKQKTAAADQVVERLLDGTYDRKLAEFEAQIEEATAVLRRALEAMKAENTLRS